MRALPLLFCFSVTAAGFILLLLTTSKAARIGGTCLVTIGSYSGVPLAATWVVVTHRDYTKRSTAWAICQLSVQSYSILGTKIVSQAHLNATHPLLYPCVSVFGTSCRLYANPTDCDGCSMTNRPASSKATASCWACRLWLPYASLLNGGLCDGQI
jgi:hypothetical protein